MIEITDAISFGDLFTGLSVLVAATGIVVSEAYDRRKQRQLARANVLKATLKSLTEAFEEGLALGEKIAWQPVNIGEYTAREVVDFGYMFSNKIRSAQPNYSVWASDEEKNSLEEMKEYIQNWQRDYAQYLESKKEIPSFNELLAKIEYTLQNISDYIRSTL